MSTKVTVSSQWNGDEIKVRGNRVTGRTMFEVGLVVEGQAKSLCIIDTGRLAGSITVQSSTRGTPPDAPALSSDVINKPNSEKEVLIGTPVEYGPWIEFGTRRSYAQPFLRPALDLAKGKVLTIVRNESRYEFKEYLQ